MMDEIKQIYYNDSYSAFITYCERHRYKLMRDLTKCPFDELPELIGISHILLSRIKTIYVLYMKKHPDCLMKSRTVKPKEKEKAAPNLEELQGCLLDIFKQHPNELIHISELTKAVGKAAKRSDIIAVLEHQKWCKIVDNSTFFYAPMA